MEIAFLAAAGLYFVLGAFVGSNGYITLLGFAATVLAIWVVVRIWRSAVRHLLWRLRNRLVVAYFFIAVVPIVLISLLVGLGTALLGGQLSIYLLTSELERRTSSLRGTTEFLIRDRSRREDWVNGLAPFLRSRYPGLELYVDDGGKWIYPENAAITPPAAQQQPASGLILRDNLMYGWAYTRKDAKIALAIFPVTREYLGSLVPDIGESAILDMPGARGLLHETLPGATEPSHNRLPPAVNVLDFEIPWGTPVPVSFWNEPARSNTEWFTIRTRPSAVLRAVFSQKSDMSSEIVSSAFLVISVLFLIAEILALIIGVSLTKTITGAIHDLYEGTLRVTRGDLSHRIPLHGQDQLGELAVSFNQMTENMQRFFKVEKERERLQAELEIAREVQRELFPKIMPSLESIRLTACCNPARMVSGDYYDYQQLENERIAIALGDVAGKGISAALLMATIQSSFRAQIRSSLQTAAVAGAPLVKHSFSTSKLVSRLNEQLYTDTAPEKYATFYCGVFDDASSTLTSTNAGHLPPILVRNGEASRLDVNGMVVGAFSHAKYDESRIRLEPQDLLVFFTDGITEPENEYGEMFGEDRLADLAVRNAHLGDQEILDCIIDAVKQWTGEGELQDDMTLLLVRRC